MHSFTLGTIWTLRLKHVSTGLASILIFDWCKSMLGTFRGDKRQKVKFRYQKFVLDYLLDYISLSGISKCGDRGGGGEIELASKMYHIFFCPSELFLWLACYEVLCKLQTEHVT